MKLRRGDRLEVKGRKIPAMLFINYHNSKASAQSNAQRLAFGLIGLLALTLTIGGCAMVGPDYVKPSVPEPEKWIESGDPKIESKEMDFSRWWTVFNDPILNELIESACRQNLTVQIAGLRVMEARAQLGIAFGFQYPQQQQAGGEASINQTSENAPNNVNADKNYDIYQTSFGAVWELDVWGKFRRAVQTGVANLEASIANYDDIVVSLIAEVAGSYVDLRISEERLAVAIQNVEIQKRSLELVENQFNAGAVTQLDVFQARGLLRTTESTTPGFKSDIRQAKNALAVFLGELPGEIDAIVGNPGHIPHVPVKIAVGIPAELLRRRPDIRLAERQLAAQSARIGVARADLFPHFTLFGSLGLMASSNVGYESNNSNFTDLFKASSFIYSVGPGVTWDIFNYGRITNKVRVEDAVFQAMAINYENTVLDAAKEVENGMIAFLRSQNTVIFLADAVKAYKSAVDLSLIQYREGSVDYQRVIDTQQDLLRSEDQLTSTAGSVDLNLISLYKALGGGWELRKDKDFVPQNIKEEMEKRTHWGGLLSPDKLEYPPSQDVKDIFYSPDW